LQEFASLVLKTLDVTESDLECPLEFHCGEKNFNPTVCKNKHFYELLVSGKARVSRGFAKLKEDFGLALIQLLLKRL